MHVTHSQFHPPPRPPCHKAGSSNRLESSPTGWDPGPGQRMWIGYAYLFIFKMCIELFWYWNRNPLLMYTYWGHKSPANSIPYAAPVWGSSLETSLYLPVGCASSMKGGFRLSLYGASPSAPRLKLATKSWFIVHFSFGLAILYR